MPVYQFGGLTPVVHPSAYVHPSAEVVGNVIIGPECMIGPCAVLRGDIGRITIGQGSNIQDGCVVHTETDEETVVGEGCVIGHKAILHGCTVKDGALVGMNASVLDGAVVETGALVAAGSVVREFGRVPEWTLAAGVPAKPKKKRGDGWDSFGAPPPPPE